MMPTQDILQNKVDVLTCNNSFRKISPCINYVQHGGGGSAEQRRHTISADADVQYGSVTPSIRRRDIFSMDVGMQYRGGTPSVRMRVLITEEAHHRCRRMCAVRISHLISTEKRMQCRTNKLLRLLVLVFTWYNDPLQTILL